MNWYKKSESATTIDDRRGLCYELSYRYVVNHPDAELIHGITTNRKTDNRTLDHAWVEYDDKVFDPVIGREFQKEYYYHIYNPIVNKRYSHYDAMITMLRYNHMGPWNEQNPPKERTNP